MAGAPEAVQAVLHVRGVARLAHLTVVDDRDAGLHLLLHGFGHGGTDPRAERGRVDRNAFLLGVHHADQVGRTRETAGVRGEKSVGAAHARHRAANATTGARRPTGTRRPGRGPSTRPSGTRASPGRSVSRPACRTPTA